MDLNLQQKLLRIPQLARGDLYDHESLVNEIKKIDVVIPMVDHGQLVDQFKIIAAIKESGNVKGSKRGLSPLEMLKDVKEEDEICKFIASH